MLMMFWLQHRRWSRRYGIENVSSVLISLTLIFVVLVYVYPLRMIFEEMFSALSGGYLPTSFSITSYDQARTLIVFYSVGFFAMSLLISQLFRTAMRSSTLLALNQVELRNTRIHVQAWAFAASFGLVSILLALVLPDGWISIAGYMYFGMFFVGRLTSYLDRRRYGTPGSQAT